MLFAGLASLLKYVAVACGTVREKEENVENCSKFSTDFMDSLQMVPRHHYDEEKERINYRSMLGGNAFWKRNLCLISCEFNSNLNEGLTILQACKRPHFFLVNIYDCEY